MSRHLVYLVKISSAAIVFGALASCATLNEEQCQTVEWVELGREDGAAGQPSTHIDKHRKACSEHKLPVDEQQWRVGWEEGIRVYCTPANGLLAGREGRYYANSCPLDLKAGFEGAYSIAKALHDARNARDRLQGELDALEADMRRAESREDRQRLRMEISTKESALLIAERRLWDAERDYDLYVISNGLRRS